MQTEKPSWFPHVFGRGIFFVLQPTVYFPHQPPSPASHRYALWFRATTTHRGGTESRLPAGHSIASLRCASEGAAKMGHRRATAPRRHLFQGNTLSRAKGEQADVPGAFLVSPSSNIALKKELLHPFQHQLTVPNRQPPQPSPPGHPARPPLASELPRS